MSSREVASEKKEWADRYVRQLLRLCDGNLTEAWKVLEVQCMQGHVDLGSARSIRSSLYTESPIDNLSPDVLDLLAQSNAALMLTCRRLYLSVPDRAALRCLGRMQSPTWSLEIAEPALAIVKAHLGGWFRLDSGAPRQLGLVNRRLERMRAFGGAADWEVLQQHVGRYSAAHYRHFMAACWGGMAGLSYSN